MSQRAKKNLPPKNIDLQPQKRSISEAADSCRFGTQNRYAVFAVCGFIFLAVVLVFGQTLRHEFINYDDNQYVYENPHLTQGLTAKEISWAFTANYACNWHPITWFSHMLDYQFYGLSPWGHHLSNVLLHAATAILLFLVLRRMTGDFWPSAFVAAVFAIHPLRAESVAWVAERKDVLSGLFFMLTLWAYVGYVRRPFSLAGYLTVIALFALGLAAKPILVTLPFVLLLLDYWPLGRMHPEAVENRSVFGSFRWGRFSIPLCLLMEKVPLLVLAAASCAATVWAQSKAIAYNEHITLSSRMGNAAISYVAYLGQLFYPSGLALLYPFPDEVPPIWKVMGAVLALAAVCVGVVAWRRRYPYLPVGWLWYMGMLLPVIGLVQVGSQAMADRYTYLPQIGLCIAFAWGVAQLCQSWPHRRWVCGLASALVLVVLMACAWRQTSFWRDSETLWTHTLQCTSKNHVAHNTLGLALIDAGRMQEAIEHCEQALRLSPNYSDAHNNLGVAMVHAGRIQEGIEHFQQALQLRPDYPEAQNNLGKILMDTDRLQEAIEHCEQALRLKPDYAEAHNDLGNALSKAGRLQEAVEHYEQALLLKPDYAEAHNNLGVFLARTGRPQEAIERFKQALRLKPDYIIACKNMALTYAGMQQSSEAVAAAQKAIILARSKGKTPLVKQIEDWLNSYRTSLSGNPNAPSPAKSTTPPP